MYMPPQFMTLQVVKEVVSKFQWPDAYEIEDWYQDGIALCFPRCTILFEEGFESEVAAYFLARDTGLNNVVSVYDALAHRGKLETPGLIKHFSPGATLEKVQHGIHDLCVVLLNHLSASLLGDFRWVPAYLAYEASTREP
jgi:hypothetical protein